MRDLGSHTTNEPGAGYVGRFAPSPSGPLHLGSMLAALASYLDAKAADGRWLLRIDDIDTPRNVDGSETTILRCLEAHGLHWDGSIMRQSERLERYGEALSELASKGLLFWCSCSRKSIGSNIYPGTCRGFTLPRSDCAIRLRTPPGEVTWQERSQSTTREGSAGDDVESENVAQRVGDYVVKRRDKIFSYQLCVVVDDADCGVTHVVRGDDLQVTTARQVQLSALLGHPAPTYLHIPTINSRSGHKLSKQTFAPGVSTEGAALTLTTLMQLLGLETPHNAVRLTTEELLAIAVEQWRQATLAGAVSIQPIDNFVGF